MSTGAGPPPFWRNLDISNEAARALIEDILEEYLPLFPGRYWHVGGDEYLTPGMHARYPQLLRDAERRKMGFLEAAEVYSGPMGIMN